MSAVGDDVSVRRRWLALLIFVAAFLAVRIALLLSAPFSVYADEELFNGTSVLEILNGFELPWTDYLYLRHEGGALLMNLLALPLYAAFGPTYLAMKLGPLLVALATFVVWYRVADRFFGPLTAYCVGALMIVAPPLLLRSEFLFVGHHSSVGLFTAVAVYLLLVRREGPAEARVLACLGIVCGLGLFFAHLFLPSLLTCGAVVVVDVLAAGEAGSPWRVRAAMRAGAIWTAGVAIGLIPWLAVRVAWQGATERVVSWDEVVVHPSELLPRAWALLTEHVPNSTCFADPAGGGHNLLGLYVPALVVVAAAAGVMTYRATGARDGQPSAYRTLPRFIYVFLGLLFILYAAASRFNAGDGEGCGCFLPAPFAGAGLAATCSKCFVHHQYLIPIYPLLFALAGLGAARAVAVARTHGRRLWWGAFAGVIALGALGAWTEIRRGVAHDPRTMQGYAHTHWGWRFYERYWRKPDHIVAIGRTLDSKDRPEFYRGVGWGIAEFGASGAEGEWTPDNLLSDDVPATLRIIGRLPPAFRNAGYDGLGWRTADVARGDPDVCRSVAERIPASGRAAFFRGVGRMVARRHHERPARALIHLEAFGATDRLAAYVGLGEVVAEKRRTSALTSHPVFREHDGAVRRSKLEEGMNDTRRRQRRGDFLIGPMSTQWAELCWE